MKMTPRGKFRWPITVLTATKAADGYGELEPTPTTFATARASIEQLSGRELFWAQQVQALATHRVKMPYVPGVLATMQVVVEAGPTYEILGPPDNVEMLNRELWLLCVEKNP
jgi:SPP1 family predicted phage head-tail adaptor